jgi:hypothetical protein
LKEVPVIRRVVLATFAVVLSFATPTGANDDAAASARWQADVTEPAFQALRAALAEAAVAANH